MTDFIFWGSNITADGDYTHEIKRCLLLRRKVMTNLDSIFGEGNGNPLQYSCLENPMDSWRRSLVGCSAWGHWIRHDWATSLSLFTSCIGEGNGNPLQCSCLENPGAGEPGRLPSMVSHRVGHDWHDLAALAADSMLKSRDVTLPTKVHLVKAMVFPGVIYGCESWTIKKAECQRIDAFELWCWRRLLRVPWIQGDPTSPS